MVPVTLAAFEVVGFPISNIQKMLIKYLLTVTFLDLLVEFTNGLRLPKWKVMYFFGSQAGSPRVWRVCSIFRTLSRCALRVPRVLGPAHCEVANAAGGWASEVRAVEMNSGRQETSVRERSDSRKAADGRLQSNGEGEVAANTAPPPRSPQPAGGALSGSAPHAAPSTVPTVRLPGRRVSTSARALGPGPLTGWRPVSWSSSFDGERQQHLPGRDFPKGGTRILVPGEV